MISIKFKDNIIKEYSIDKLNEIPFFKGLIESCNKIDDVIPFNDFDSDVIDHLIHNYKNINFDKYKFDDLFQAKEFLRLYELDKTKIQYTDSSIQYQFRINLIYLLVNTFKINLNNLKRYLLDENEYFLSHIVSEHPKLTHLYSHIEHLVYSKVINLTKFNNLVALNICDNEIETFVLYGNLKNLKKLYCSNCVNLKDGCFDIFENLEELNCSDCRKLTKPFDNLKNLRILKCASCELVDGCFDNLTNLVNLDCEWNYELKRPFNNLINLKILECAVCTKLEDGCFDNLINLVNLVCDSNCELKKPFSNLINLKILECSGCRKLEYGCFDNLINLIELHCKGCCILSGSSFLNSLRKSIINEKLKSPFDNLKNLKILYCDECGKLGNDCFDNLINLETLDCDHFVNLKTFPRLTNLKTLNCNYCHNLEDGCFDMLTNLELLNCSHCTDLKKPFNNLKNLKKLFCRDTNLEDGCFDTFISLEILDCYYCQKLKKPFSANLKSVKELYCQFCKNLENRCFDELTNLEELHCLGCDKLSKPIEHNLKKLNSIYCCQEFDDIPGSYDESLCSYCLDAIGCADGLKIGKADLDFKHKYLR